MNGNTESYNKVQITGYTQEQVRLESAKVILYFYML